MSQQHQPNAREQIPLSLRIRCVSWLFYLLFLTARQALFALAGYAVAVPREAPGPSRIGYPRA